MTTVKTTDLLLPEVDRLVRKLWAWFIERGYDATYFTALNILVLQSMYTADVSKEPAYRDKDPAYLDAIIKVPQGVEEGFGGYGSYDLSYLAGGYGVNTRQIFLVYCSHIFARGG